MRLLNGFLRAGAVRLTGVLLATVAIAACCVGVSSAAPGVIRTVHVGSGAAAVSSDGTHVWVVSSPSYPAKGTVSEIEASSGTVIRTIPVGVDACGGGVSSDGTHVWVTNCNDGTVSEIEASSGTVIRTIPVGGYPHGVSSDGTHVWVAGGGPSGNDGTVTEIEDSSGTVIRTIPVGGYPDGVSSDGTHVWVTNDSEKGTVTEIEDSSGTVIRTINVGSGPSGVSSDGTHVWVANDVHHLNSWCVGNGTVSEIEASSGTVVRTIPVGLPFSLPLDRAGSCPDGVSSDGAHVWVANSADGTVSEIEASSGTVVGTIPVGGPGPGGVSWHGTHVWVTGDDTVSELPASYTGAKKDPKKKPQLTKKKRR
jgi:YVTN family beta-propeller protein